jgi:hypothetical protein
MRVRLHLVALALAASLSTGCFVLDELDKGNAILDAHASKASKDAKAKAAAEAAANKGGAPATPEEKRKQWWSSASSLSTADQAPKEDPHIRCRIEKDERFMRRSDCLSQGGKIL